MGDKYSFLNFEIAEKVQPIWTIQAKDAGAIGLVQVEVLIDEKGNVLTARARPEIHCFIRRPNAQHLRRGSISRTSMVSLRGAMGFIVYRFGTEEQEYEQERKNKEKTE
jgi:hypothetical protein